MCIEVNWLRSSVTSLCVSRSKKQAKHECAQKALDSFVQFRDAFEGVVNAASANGAGTPLPTGSTKVSFFQVLSLTQLYYVDLIKDQCKKATHNQGFHQLILTVSKTKPKKLSYSGKTKKKQKKMS